MDGDKEQNITEAEAALYDRQIRLWGLDAQKRLRAARVLLVGVSGLGAEVAKNIVLSGIKSLVLLDHTEVTEEDCTSQFLVNRDDVGKNRAESSLSRTQLLNPMVDVTVDTDNVTEKQDDFFVNFDVICATRCDEGTIVRINNICNKNNIKFYAGDVFGYFAYMFADLNNHEYAEEVNKSTMDGEPAAKKAKVDAPPETVTVKKQKNYCRFKSAMAVEWESATERTLKRTPNTFFILRILLAFREKQGRYPSIKNAEEDKACLKDLRESVMSELKVSKDLVPEDFTDFCFAALSPVCAVAGGILGQEIIKALSHKDPPHNNFFFYNGVDGSGLVDTIENELITELLAANFVHGL